MADDAVLHLYRNSERTLTMGILSWLFDGSKEQQQYQTDLRVNDINYRLAQLDRNGKHDSHEAKQLRATKRNLLGK